MTVANLKQLLEMGIVNDDAKVVIKTPYYDGGEARTEIKETQFLYSEDKNLIEITLVGED